MKKNIKRVLAVFCLMLVVGTTLIPKPCEEHHKLDYCWLEKVDTKGTSNGDK